MATYGDGFEVPAPPISSRPRGLLLDVAQDLDLGHPLGDEGDRGFDDPNDRVIGGINFCGGNACINVDGLAIEWCDEFALPSEDGGFVYPTATEDTFGAFTVVTEEEAPTHTRREWLFQRASERLRARWSALVARELMTGELSGNPSLMSAATHVVSAVTPAADAPFVVEDILASFEDIAFVIHMDPATFTYLANAWNYEQDDKERLEDPNPQPFRTPTGHIVVADAGYTPGVDDDFGPDDPDTGVQVPTATDNRWIYASLMPHYWTGPESRLGNETANLDITVNKAYATLMRNALIAFDPCVVVAVQVDVPTYALDIVGSG
jgi:hypothetical protein